MHPLTPTTSPKPGTWGIPPLGRAFNDLVKLGEIDTPPATDLSYRDEIPWCGEGNEYDTIVQMAETIAARNKLFDPNGGGVGILTEFIRVYDNSLLSWDKKSVLKFKIQDSATFANA